MGPLFVTYSDRNRCRIRGPHVHPRSYPFWKGANPQGKQD
jgi:hypothetical protein